MQVGSDTVLTSIVAALFTETVYCAGRFWYKSHQYVEYLNPVFC